MILNYKSRFRVSTILQSNKVNHKNFFQKKNAMEKILVDFILCKAYQTQIAVQAEKFLAGRTFNFKLKNMIFWIYSF